MSSDPDIDQHYRLFGFADYVRKPFDLDHLYEVICKYLPRGRKWRGTSVFT